MRVLTVLLLSLITFQAPPKTYIKAEGIACTSIKLWIEYTKAAHKRDYKTLRNINLSQRCVYQGIGEVKVLARTPNYVQILGRDQRKLYTAKAYILE